MTATPSSAHDKTTPLSALTPCISTLPGVASESVEAIGRSVLAEGGQELVPTSAMGLAGGWGRLSMVVVGSRLAGEWGMVVGGTWAMGPPMSVCCCGVNCEMTN